MEYDYLYEMYKIPKKKINQINNETELISVVFNDFNVQNAKNFISYSDLSLNEISQIVPVSLSTLQRTFKNKKKTFFTSPIKKAEENRIKTHLELAQDALALRLQQRTVTETTTVTRSSEQGEYSETKIQEKVIQPSDTLIMFTLVNKSEGEWQSINKVENTVNNTNNLPSIQLEWTEPKNETQS